VGRWRPVAVRERGVGRVRARSVGVSEWRGWEWVERGVRTDGCPTGSISGALAPPKTTPSGSSKEVAHLKELKPYRKKTFGKMTPPIFWNGWKMTNVYNTLTFYLLRCRSSWIQPRKIGFTMFWYFCDLLRILQV
jgi:hypothetical protein